MFRSENNCLLKLALIGLTACSILCATSVDAVAQFDDGFPSSASPDTQPNARGFSGTLSRPSAQGAAPSPVEDADRLLYGGNAAAAYKLLRKLAPNLEAAQQPLLLLRLGLASELSGAVERGESHYREAIRISRRHSAVQIQSLLGLARIWQHSRRETEAKELLSQLALNYRNDSIPSQIRLAIHHQLSECFQLAQLQNDKVTEATIPCEFHWPLVQAETILANATLPISVPPQQEQIRLVQRPSEDALQILFDARSERASILRLLDQLVDSAGLTLDISTNTRSLLAGRKVDLASDGVAMALLLDRILAPFEIVWQQDQDTIVVTHADELSTTAQRQFQTARIRRQLRSIELSFVTSTQRLVAFMHDGNFALRAGDTKQAENSFQSALEMKPIAEIAAKLFFNQALLGKVKRQPVRALESFYNALDQTLSPRLQALAYANIAKLELKLGHPSKAIPAAARGLRLASTPEQATGNLLVLAKSYLLQPDPYSANRVLFENANMLAGEKNRRIGSLLSTYARFRVVEPSNGLQNEGERLVIALAAIRPTDSRDFIDHLILSRANADVGFRTQAREHLRIAFDQSPDGYWKERTRLELARLLYEASDLKQANEILSSVARANHPELSVPTFLLRSMVQLELGLMDECDATCRSLLQFQLNEKQKAETLNMLGQVHRKRGHHYAAALCFAGLLPKEPSKDFEAKGSEISTDSREPN